MELDQSTDTRRNLGGRGRRRALAILTVLSLTVGGLTVSAGPAAAATRMASFDAQMIAMVNQARAANGLPAVQAASGLTSLSVWWSNEMAIGHTGYQLKHNPNAWDMLPRYGAASRTSWGENVAKFSPSSVPARDIFNAYMASPGHRANILGRGYRYIGMGTMAGAHGTFNTMTFTDKVDAGQVAAPPKPVRVTFRVQYRTSHGPVAGVRYSIRQGNCDASRQVAQKTTASSGAFAMDLKVTAYCSIPTAWPHNINRPPRVDFRLTAGKSYVATALVTLR